MRMPKKLKAKWIKALRSGEYGQCAGRLTDGKGNFCCLGVLQHVASGGKCEIYSNDNVRYMEAPSSAWYRDNGIIGNDALSVAGGEVESVLMEMNDGIPDYSRPPFKNGERRLINRKTFKTIATYIEAIVGTTD